MTVPIAALQWYRFSAIVIKAGEGVYYLLLITNAYSRKIVGCRSVYPLQTLKIALNE
jgi:hypothetical protein